MENFRFVCPTTDAMKKSVRANEPPTFDDLIREIVRDELSNQ